MRTESRKGEVPDVCKTGYRIPDTGKDSRLPLSPVAAAIADYRRHGCQQFRNHLMDHLTNGYVFSSPSLFLLAKAVALEDDRIAWYITYARGDRRALLAQLPFPLPWIAFKRLRKGRERRRVYRFDRFAELVTTGTRRQSAATTAL